MTCHTKKCKNKLVSNRYIHKRSKGYHKHGYPKPKWMLFCEHMNEFGLECWLYEARRTNSKYITVKLKDFKLKVRFSDHRPNIHRENNNDCDYWVGVSNYTTYTWKEISNVVLRTMAHLNLAQKTCQ